MQSPRMRNMNKWVGGGGGGGEDGVESKTIY